MRSFGSSLELVTAANEFLDELSQGKEASLENSLELAEIKSEMLDRDFSAPFSGVLAITSREMGEPTEADYLDQKKQASYLRYLASLKKFTLNRVRVAHSAHLIALRLGKPELVPFLPLGGDYLKKVVAGGDAAVKSYRTAMDALSESNAPYSQTIAKVEYTDGGKKKAETFKVSFAERLDERVKRIYGEDARVLETQVVKEKKSAIKNKSTRVALSCAVALYCMQEISREGKKREEGGKLREYNLHLKKWGLQKNSRLDLSEGFEKEKEELASLGFGSFEEGIFSLEEGLVKEVNAWRSWEDTLARKISLQKLAEALFLAYATTNEAQRKSESPLPSLAANPAQSQLGAVEIKGGLFELKNPSLFLLEKIASENLSAGIPPRLFGMGLACTKGGLSQEDCMKLFSASREEVLEAVRKVSALEGRGAEFLKRLGND